jgi:hypothetical protein
MMYASVSLLLGDWRCLWFQVRQGCFSLDSTWESRLPEPVESVADQQEPEGGESGSDDDGDIPARYRNDPQDARDQAHISRHLIEDALEHDQTDQENPKGEDDYGVDSFQAGCQHCRRIIAAAM